MIARRGSSSETMTSPGCAVTLDKFLGRTVGISIITGGENSSGDDVEQPSRKFTLSSFATRDIAGTDQHRGD